MQIIDDLNKRVEAHREFIASPAGHGRMTLKFLSDEDAGRTMRVIPKDQRSLVSHWTGQRAFNLESKPKAEGHLAFTLQDDTDSAQGERTCVRDLPAGYELTAAWVDDKTLVLEVAMSDTTKPATAPPPDGLETLSDADLQTKMAENGLTYNPKKFDRFKGLESLKAKLAAKRPEPLPE